MAFTLVSGKLIHPRNPVLTWCASNVVVEMDAAGNIKPNRKKSTEKIDGIVAMAMAIGRILEKKPGEEIGFFIL